MSEEFASCLKCKGGIDLHHTWSYRALPYVIGYICANCDAIKAQKKDPSINPLPDHMHALVEPHIQWREAQAVAKFLLQTIEDQNSPAGGGDITPAGEAAPLSSGDSPTQTESAHG